MEGQITISVLMVGLIIVLGILNKYGCDMLAVSPVPGYIILGILIKYLGDYFQVLNTYSYEVLAFLGNLGIVAFLFRIGLESKLEKLVRGLPQAFPVWIGDVTVSGAAGFVAARFLLGLDLIPSLFVTAALVPTSVGISMAAWEEFKMLGSRDGVVLLDTAELDDLFGILVMGIVLTMSPRLYAHEGGGYGDLVLQVAGVFVLKALLFGGLCYLAARYLERRITGYLTRLHSGESTMLVVAGLAFIIAAMAASLDFSLAIGAFFAGLIFSSDPGAVKIDTSFEALHNLFVPFFFVGIGMIVDPNILSSLGWPLLVLFLAAVLGKIIGAGVPAAVTLGGSSAMLIGISMIPRAEISLLILQKGHAMGEWAISAELFASLVIVSGITAVSLPLVFRRLIQIEKIKKRWISFQ